MRQIHCRRVILMIVFFERWRIVSQRRFTTFPMWQRPRFGNLVCEVRAKSAQSDSFRAYRVECAKSSCFPALPTCWTCAMPLRRRRPPKYRLEIPHAGCSEKAACILCYNMESPKRNFHPSSAQLHHKHSDIREYGGMERSDADLLHQQRFALLIRPNPASSWNIKRILFVRILDCQSLTVSLIF